ncbi:hypothetical protein METESE_36270 [Mesoterricola sediminis]|uniref:Uncharacterized protein n=1 Tax=Mesoterricola sediminis TaxID=2927980 RepID=A0AA48GVP3_9BACT|nr:hypothetical protein METESE_36270 [Mesoterricola sediminis]
MGKGRVGCLEGCSCAGGPGRPRGGSPWVQGGIDLPWEHHEAGLSKEETQAHRQLARWRKRPRDPRRKGPLHRKSRAQGPPQRCGPRSSAKLMRIILRPEEAPGVRDGRLRETWAWLSIQVNDTTCLTEGMLQSGLRAEGVYGSYLPLLEWLLENWWSLLHEGAPSAVPFARSFFPSDAAWVRRHNLVAAREGFALPDCSIFADEDVIRLQWHPEPAQEGQRIRFIGSGEARIGREPFTAALRGFIEAALGRLRDALEGGRLVDTPDLRQLFAAWHAIREAKGAEAAFCRVMGALGVDPYDPDAIPESLAGVVEGVIRDFADPLRDALVAGSGPETLASRRGCAPTIIWMGRGQAEPTQPGAPSKLVMNAPEDFGPNGSGPRTPCWILKGSSGIGSEAWKPR